MNGIRVKWVQLLKKGMEMGSSGVSERCTLVGGAQPAQALRKHLDSPAHLGATVEPLQRYDRGQNEQQSGSGFGRYAGQV